MRLIFGGIFCAAMAGAAFGQDTGKRVNANSDWSVFTSGDPKECWVASKPKKTSNQKNGRAVSVKRSDILLFVSYRPGSEVAAEVAFTGGYPFKENSNVSLKVDEATYEMFVEGEWAWPASPGEDAKIVTAMRRGAEAVLVGESSRGTVTTDTFSLIGLTASLEEAEKLCSS